MYNGGENRNRNSFANGSHTPQLEAYEERVATALPVNSVSVTIPAKKIMYHPWNLGAKSFFFMIGGLAPLVPM